MSFPFIPGISPLNPLVLFPVSLVVNSTSFSVCLLLLPLASQFYPLHCVTQQLCEKDKAGYEQQVTCAEEHNK